MADPVAAAYRSFPPAARRCLERIRALIFETAAALDGVGPITETLKWGEPAYLTERSRSGTTVRLGWKAGPLPMTITRRVIDGTGCRASPCRQINRVRTTCFNP